ncbi:MAG: sialidase family protein [Actinomycetota bacterium]
MISKRKLRRFAALVLLATTALQSEGHAAVSTTAIDNKAAMGTDMLAEPAVAVSPRDPNRVITAAVDQDENLVPVFASVDGAFSFKRGSYLPLAGGDVESDPALAYDSAGRAYASYMSYDPSSDAAGGIAIARSDDGGLSWPTAKLVVRNMDSSAGCQFADFPSIDIDRRSTSKGKRADRIYLVWQVDENSEGQCESQTVSGIVIRIARSDDGGTHWKQLGEIPHPHGANTYIPVVSMAADGTVLVALAMDLPGGSATDCNGNGFVHMMVASSSDSGVHWRTSDAHSGACNPFVTGGLYSLSGATYRMPDNTNVVESPKTGTFLSVAAIGDAVGAWNIDVTRSTDHKTWSSGGSISHLPNEMLEFPRIAVSKDGTFYLLYISELTGSVLIAKMAVSTDDGQTWGNPIQLSSRPGAGNNPFFNKFVGDYIANTVGSDGKVHPMWTDARPGIGSRQHTTIYTAHLGS